MIMKNVRVRLQFKDEIYNSKFVEVNDEEFEKLKTLLKSIASGEIKYFSMEVESLSGINQTKYFSKRILKRSILSLEF